jgi:hypothetical protein
VISTNKRSTFFTREGGVAMEKCHSPLWSRQLAAALDTSLLEEPVQANAELHQALAVNRRSGDRRARGAEREFGIGMRRFFRHGVPPAGPARYLNEFRHCLIEYSVADSTPAAKRPFAAE